MKSTTCSQRDNKKPDRSPGSGVASVVVTVVTAPVACAEVTVVVMVGMVKGEGWDKKTGWAERA